MLLSALARVHPPRCVHTSFSQNPCPVFVPGQHSRLLDTRASSHSSHSSHSACRLIDLCVRVLQQLLRCCCPWPQRDACFASLAYHEAPFCSCVLPHPFLCPFLCSFLHPFLCPFPLPCAAPFLPYPFLCLSLCPVLCPFLCLSFAFYPCRYPGLSWPPWHQLPSSQALPLVLSTSVQRPLALCPSRGCAGCWRWKNFVLSPSWPAWVPRAPPSSGAPGTRRSRGSLQALSLRSPPPSHRPRAQWQLQGWLQHRWQLADSDRLLLLLQRQPVDQLAVPRKKSQKLRPAHHRNRQNVSTSRSDISGSPAAAGSHQSPAAAC
mmetsp:Transcript_8859/g.25952  ORF Transcript_8859/g.25952 Transcript_8859/m.25952 type:complete len:320 (+) Transcript_8859:777-1736(+)